jgi:methylated-DNA-[protein]-cysteine S-methyltransferase
VKRLLWSEVPSPVGLLRLGVASGGAVVGIDFLAAPRDRFRSGLERLAERHGFEATEDAAATRALAEQLEEYFQGVRRHFEVELEPLGSSFQLAVWQELRRIPYGETRSYGQIAEALGWPGASRAVGAANGANPIPIVVPCHRVIGANGSLTGFGGGLPAKRTLLTLEGVGAEATPTAQLRLSFGVDDR